MPKKATKTDQKTLRGRYKWAALDKVRKFRQVDDKLKAANKLGYSYISEALIKEYRNLKSARKVGELLGFTSAGVRFALVALGETLFPVGGFRVGDIRRGRPRGSTNT
jgi:hypothetical protein